ncbi:MAG: hypothetical protein RIB57_15940 [Pelagibacterium sp.]|uniref:hypothetical protein n=1 Tax=Pelagibacterium sp. TaxID=1967288 RepID=UPI0032ED6C93
MSLALHRGLDPQSYPDTPTGIVDRSFVSRRLLRNAVTLVNAHPRADYLGPDKLVDSLAHAKGFTGDDLAILRVSIGRGRHTLICAPEMLWYSRKFDLLELKQMAGFAGRSCCLIPESAVQRQPRLSTARAIEDACGVSVSVDQRMAILVHMIENGGKSTFMDCACAIDHPQPFSAVMHMVALGVLRIDATTELRPHSTVSLNDRSPEEAA